MMSWIFFNYIDLVKIKGPFGSRVLEGRGGAGRGGAGRGDF